MYKLYCEIIIHNVTSPGTRLPNRDDIYLTIDSFNQVKRTNLCTCSFPLTFQKRFSFEKIFWSCGNPEEVVKAMEDIPVTVELRQVADIYLGGTLLGYFDTNARDFFHPCPNLCPRSAHNRELLMIRTVDFPGISPKVEFSSYAIIQKLNQSATDKGEARRYSSSLNKRSSRRAQYPSSFCEPNYGLPTVNSALRSRSPSPKERAMAKGHVISDIVNHKVRDNEIRNMSVGDERQPFVVRHTNENMIGRKPKLHKPCNSINCSNSSQYHKRCHSRCHSPTKVHTPSIGERLEQNKSRKSIQKTVRSLSRPNSPIYYSHMAPMESFHSEQRYRYH